MALDLVQGPWRNFVPILYLDPAFEAFCDFNCFVESVSCESSKSCQVRGSIQFVPRSCFDHRSQQHDPPASVKHEPGDVARNPARFARPRCWRAPKEKYAGGPIRWRLATVLRPTAHAVHMATLLLVWLASISAAIGRRRIETEVALREEISSDYRTPEGASFWLPTGKRSERAVSRGGTAPRDL